MEHIFAKLQSTGHGDIASMIRWMQSAGVIPNSAEGAAIAKKLFRELGNQVNLPNIKTIIGKLASNTGRSPTTMADDLGHQDHIVDDLEHEGHSSYSDGSTGQSEYHSGSHSDYQSGSPSDYQSESYSSNHSQ